jgi:hypothetical protein
MKIGIVSVDSKIPNLALMKISAFHKAKGHKVEMFNPLFSNYDLVYASKVFTNTKDNEYLPYNAIKGGSGYDLKSVLPDEIEFVYPDYSLFNCEYAMGFTSRGCIRNCPWCIVPKKEGKIKAVADIYQFWHGQSHLKLLDGNLTALPDHFEKILNQLIKEKIYVDFNQGLDIRLLTPEMAKLLSIVRLWKQIHFAWDSMSYEHAVRRGIHILSSFGMYRNKVMFYVLIGFDTTPEEDLYRVEVLRGLNIDPFVMPFNRRDEYQRKFARWVNHKAIFKSVGWEEYKNHKEKVYATP